MTEEFNLSDKIKYDAVIYLEQRRRNGGFAPFKCKQCFSMNCGSHSDICDLCKDKNRREEEKE